AGARAVAVLTGAGVSADSGVPTFRGADGLWRTHRAEDLATPEAFARDPRLGWEWYNWRREFIATKSPNAAHYALVELERGVGRSSEVLPIIGTSGIVYPAASSASLAKEAGAFVAEVNLDPTPNTQIVDVAIRGRAKDIVPVLL